VGEEDDMKIIYHIHEKINADFARSAAEHFRDHPSNYTYTDGDVKPGELFAVRWNKFSVAIFKLDDIFEPAIYPVAQFLRSDLPPLQPVQL
jgi:hypothetical protein